MIKRRSHNPSPKRWFRREFLLLLLVACGLWFWNEQTLKIVKNIPSLASKIDLRKLGPVRDIPAPPSTLARFHSVLPEAIVRVQEVELKRHQMIAQALKDVGVAGQDAAEALASLQNLFDFRRLREGDSFKAGFDKDGLLKSLEIARGPLEQARTIYGENGWVGQRVEVDVYSLLTQVSGEVESSLWDAVISTGEDPRLVDTMVEMFAWDIDFFTEVHPKDTFKLLVEKRFVEGTFVGYGPVWAAEFVTSGKRHQAYAHQKADGTVAYYDGEGRTMQKQLLRTPVKFARVTSTFGTRLHPILGYTRAHNGVDYGVPTGTPVWSVADGKVVYAGVRGGFGKYVAVQHSNGWFSEYAHLSRIQVRVGQRVSQKQMVGAVGCTGLASGPHLHFGLKSNGRYVNPLAQKFSRMVALKGEERNRFLAQAAQFAAELDRLVVAHGSVVCRLFEG